MLNTLYVTSHRARIRVVKGTLHVSDVERGDLQVPLEQLEAIVLLGNAEITTPAMATCVKRGIPVTSLTRNGTIRFRVTGGTAGNVHLRVSQLQAHLDPSETAAIARSLVAGKLQNARAMMSRWLWDASGRTRAVLRRQREGLDETIGALSDASATDQIRGLEGTGAYRYFAAMRAVLAPIGLGFSGRHRRPPRDPVNALLSFTYGLALSEVVGAVQAVGLDPQVGFLHRLRSGRPSLALDLVEELRPAYADRFVVRMLRRGEMTIDSFETTAGGACHLTDGARRDVLGAWSRYRDEVVFHRLLERNVPRWSLPQVQATLMARHLRGDLPAYAPYLMAQ